MGKSESQGYVTPFKPVPLDVDFPENFNARLVTCQSDLKELVHELKEHKKIAIDTETNSTDWGYGHIVGMSMSTDKDSGWYLPFRHEEYNRNLPLALLDKLYQIVAPKRILMYNAPFDETMLNKEGWDCRKLKIRDVMGLVWLRDTNIHLPDLKSSTLQILGRKVPTFEETLKGREHFGWIPPEEAYFYACCDTGDTFGIDEILYPMLSKEAPKIVQLDNKFVPVLMDLCNVKLPVRQELLKSLEDYYANQLEEKEKQIFKAVGYPFNIKSNKQLEMAFKQMGIKTGYTTEKGNMVLKSEVLDLIAPKYPFVKEIITYKSMGSTLSALKKFRDKDWIRCNYEMFNTVTGRMSSGSAKDEGKLNLPKGVRPYFDNFNAQNFLKPSSMLYKGRYAPEDPYNLLGYRFTPIEKEDIQPDDLIAEGMDYRGNPRRLIRVYEQDENGEVIISEKTHYWVKSDYAGAELRLATLFSKEPVLYEAFKHGIDPHTNTAKMMFGVGDKPHRAKAKTCNFSLLYEGSADSLSRNSGLSYEEADELWHKYWQTMTTLKSWKVAQQSRANVTCTCATFLGRPRRLHWYFRNPSFKMRSFAKRSVISHMIQGSLGDIIKLTLINATEKIFRHPDWKDDTRLYMTIHDELDPAVRRERIHEYLDYISEIGRIQLPEWGFPLELDHELGFSYGFSLGVVKDKDTGLWKVKFKKGSDIIG